VKILILGAGQVGGTLAESLAQEAFDITLVDIDGERLQDLGMRLDIQTIEGSASHPNVLRKAGADDADMLIAVTSSDEINMVACQVCYSLLGLYGEGGVFPQKSYAHRPPDQPRSGGDLTNS
jgi:trk system potassium uptake protein TrkA